MKKEKLKLNSEKKRTLEDMEGIIKLDYPTNSVDLKKELYK